MSTIYGTPEVAKKVGVYNDQVVYSERVPVYRKEVLRDSDGNILWHTRGDVKVKEKTRLVQEGYEEREFVLLKLRNNLEQKAYDFRADPNEELRRAEEASVEEGMREIVQAVQAEGFSMKDFVKQVLGAKPSKGKA